MERIPHIFLAILVPLADHAGLRIPHMQDTNVVVKALAVFFSVTVQFTVDQVDDMRDSFHMLDEKLIFANTKTGKKDYASKSLEYPLEPGETPAWDRLVLLVPMMRKALNRLE